MCICDHVPECDILLMYLFLPYCVRKWHNKPVQSIGNLIRRVRAGIMTTYLQIVVEKLTAAQCETESCICFCISWFNFFFYFPFYFRIPVLQHRASLIIMITKIVAKKQLYNYFHFVGCWFGGSRHDNICWTRDCGRLYLYVFGGEGWHGYRNCPRWSVLYVQTTDYLCLDKLCSRCSSGCIWGCVLWSIQCQNRGNYYKTNVAATGFGMVHTQGNVG